MQFTIFKLKFRTPLHIGDNRPNYESCERFVHSDTLFSALINTWKLLYPDDLDVFFPESAPASISFPYFRISSAFPFAGEELFFPKPFYSPPYPQDGDSGDAKTFKKLIWIGKNHLEQWLKGESLKIEDACLSPDKHFLFSDKIPEYQPNPVIVQDSPRIRKDRETEQTEIFYYSRLYFAENAGLYFLATFQNEEWERKFNAVLNLLGDEGLGGDRTVGNGLFEVIERKEGFSLILPEKSNHFLTLSLYHPKSGEMSKNLDNSYYELINRSGWVYSGRGHSLRRNNVRMFSEGSVFCGSGNERGDVVKVLDPLPELNLPHAVYRYGQVLSLPISVAEEAL